MSMHLQSIHNKQHGHIWRDVDDKIEGGSGKSTEMKPLAPFPRCCNLVSVPQMEWEGGWL